MGMIPVRNNFKIHPETASLNIKTKCPLEWCKSRQQTLVPVNHNSIRTSCWRIKDLPRLRANH